MPLTPGSANYNNALDHYITGGNDPGMGDGPNSDDFYALAEKRLWKEMDAHLRSLVMGEYNWEGFVSGSGLDEHGAQRVLAQFHHPPTNEMGREVMAAINEATAAMKKVAQIIGLNDWVITELARDLEDDYDDGKEVEGL